MSDDTLPDDAGPCVLLRAPDGAAATVLLHGAHVVSWRTAGDGLERLYTSPKARYGDGQAIRGGVPVCFPQFGDRGPDTALAFHGFARRRAWQLVDQGVGEGPDANQAWARLRLSDDEATRALWPHAFQLELEARVGGDRLDIELSVRATGGPLAFTAALHTYLAVADLPAVRLEGLDGSRYFDKAGGGVEATQGTAPIAFGPETDRIYWGVGERVLRLVEPTRGLTLAQEGFGDTVVWNPGAQRAAQLADLAAGGEARFVCVEAAAIQPPVTLAPGQRWQARQRLKAS